MGSLLPRRAPAVSLYLLSTLLASAPLARAQNADQAPGHIEFVEGRATVERDGQADAAASGAPIVPGDSVRTDGGRLEILFPDGTALDIDEYTSLDLQSPTLLRVTSGRVLLTVTGTSSPASAMRYQIDTPAASATTEGPGEYRVALFSAQSGLETEFAVVRGAGALTTERGSVALRAGERSLARDNESPMYAQTFNSARFDAFDRWAAIRRDARMGTAASAQYLPNELRPYGRAFDSYGAWQNEPTYGNVWYPSVGVDWRPYYDGYWSPLPVYGWTWVGYNAWSWPTHHYGRWGYARDRWFWIPERHFAAAWVSWGAAPGYVSWCPLGFDNRPVFALSINIGNPWTGWTVVPRTHFCRYSTPQWAVAPHRLRENTPFLAQMNSPVSPPTRAVPRTVVSAGTQAGTVATPRSAAGRVQRPAAAAQSAEAQVPSIDRSTSARNPTFDSRRGVGTPRVSTGGDARLSMGDTRSPAASRQPQQADAWFKRPIVPDGSAGATQSRVPPATRSPEPSRSYQRNPSATYMQSAPVRPPQTTAPAAESGQAAVPRWQYYGSRTPGRTEPSPQRPQTNESPSAAIPRWQPYSRYSGQSGSTEPETPPPSRSYSPPPSRSYSPPPSRSYSPPPSRQSEPSYRAPAAQPRNAPPPSSGSGSGSSEGRERSGGGSSGSGSSGSSSGGGGGARQRHP